MSLSWPLSSASTEATTFLFKSVRVELFTKLEAAAQNGHCHSRRERAPLEGEAWRKRGEWPCQRVKVVRRCLLVMRPLNMPLLTSPTSARRDRVSAVLLVLLVCCVYTVCGVGSILCVTLPFPNAIVVGGGPNYLIGSHVCTLSLHHKVLYILLIRCRCTFQTSSRYYCGTLSIVMNFLVNVN